MVTTRTNTTTTTTTATNKKKRVVMTTRSATTTAETKMVSPETTKDTTSTMRVTRSAAAAAAGRGTTTSSNLKKKATVVKKSSSSLKKKAAAVVIKKKKQPPIKAKKTTKNKTTTAAAAATTSRKRRKTTTTTKKDSASVRSTNATVTGGKGNGNKPSLETVRHELMLKWQHECSTENAQALLRSLLERPDIGPLGFIEALNPNTKQQRNDIISDVTLSECLKRRGNNTRPILMPSSPSSYSTTTSNQFNNKPIGYMDKMDRLDVFDTRLACADNYDLDETKVYEHFYKRDSNNITKTDNTNNSRKIPPANLDQLIRRRNNDGDDE